MMDDEAKRVSKELQVWVKKMGFNQGFASTNDFPSAETFEKVCKHKTIQMWKDIMMQVRPKEEILHIQKNLLLQQLQFGKRLDEVTVPGHISRQVVLSNKIAVKKKEREDLLEAVHLKETSIRAKDKALKKSALKVSEMEHQINELKIKELMFKVKCADCSSKLKWYKEIVSFVSGLCPPPPYAKPSSNESSGTAEAVLRRCLDIIRDFHSKHQESYEVINESSNSQETELHSMWTKFESNINGWGAKHLWDAINLQLMPELMEEISSLCGDDFDSTKPSQNHASHTTTAISCLPAKQMISVLKYILLETKAKMKAAELKHLQEELVETLGASKFNASQLNMSVKNVPEVAKAWIYAQSKRAELAGKLQGIKAGLLQLKETMPDRNIASSNFKAVKEELARLDLQVDHDKRQLEENFARMKTVAPRVRAAHAKALAQKGNFNSRVPLFLKKTRSNPSPSDRHNSSLQRKAPLSSTMIGNVTADSNLSFNTTCDSLLIGDKSGGQSNVVVALKESISKEAKLFIKVHMDKIPFIFLKGKRVSLCNLIVEAPVMISRSSSISQKTYMQTVGHTPFTSAPLIILNHLHSVSHVRSLLMFKALHQHSPPALMQASSANLGVMRTVLPKQTAELQEKIEGVDAVIAQIKSLLAKTNKNLFYWDERPVQEVIYCLDLTVNGTTFKEWCRMYDGQAKMPSL